MGTFITQASILAKSMGPPQPPPNIAAAALHVCKYLPRSDQNPDGYGLRRWNSDHLGGNWTSSKFRMKSLHKCLSIGYFGTWLPCFFLSLIGQIILCSCFIWMQVNFLLLLFVAGGKVEEAAIILSSFKQSRHSMLFPILTCVVRQMDVLLTGFMCRQGWKKFIGLSAFTSPFI